MSASTGSQTQGEPIRIQFAPGATSATLEGRITKNGESIIYVFGATAGQQMTLVVTEPNPFGFVPVEVIKFANGTVEGPITTSYTGEIPETGDNYITVSTNQMASNLDTGSFTLTLEIT